MRLRRLLSCGLLVSGLLVASPAICQVNIEAMRAAGDPGVWKHQIGVQAGLRAGSVERADVGLDFRSEHEGKAGDWLGLIDGEIGWQDGRRYSNQGLAHLRYTRGDDEKQLTTEIFLQFDYALQRRLRSRGLLGGGLRWRWTSTLFFGTGIMLEGEENDLPTNASLRTRHVRSTNYVSGNLAVGKGKLSFTAYVQPRLNRMTDVRTLLDSRLSAPLSSKAGISLSLRLRHDNQPLHGVEKLDLKLSAGMTLEI